MGFKLIKANKMNDEYKVVINEYKANSLTIEYYDKQLKELKETNKNLYDSLKIFKDEIDYLIQFKYQKEYVTDTVYCNIEETDKDINVYEYSNDLNDTLNYTLKIGSIYEPNWYKLNLMLSEQFTIVNRKKDDLNITTIETKSNNTSITDVTALKNKNEKFLDRFEIGPSVTTGYDVVNKNLGIMVGVSIVYKLPLK
ncbi:MAG: hypothetical protein IKT40_09020 [Bacilli bacterium]|nr:hypothetical protein [Bacilli bacterium]